MVLTMPSKTPDVRAWAKIGAAQRLKEIDQEARQIVAAFPDLRAEGSGGRKRGRPPTAPGVSSDVTPGSSTKSENARPHKRRTMSEEARAKIAAAQRARWAKQKKAAGKADKTARNAAKP
jgi:hypothetical protein